MGLYARYILPRVVHLACSLKENMRQREKVVPRAQGRVLEIGIGSGLNLEYYDASVVELVWGLDPSMEMWGLARPSTDTLAFPVEFIHAGAEDIPLEKNSVDTVVTTYTLCTIPEVESALGEIRRVMKPDARLVFCEHGLAPDERIRRWQNRLNPVWRKLGGGCNLNRDIPALLVGAGFHILELRKRYMPGWKPANFNYWGCAT